jgi:hypothetical protein
MNNRIIFVVAVGLAPLNMTGEAHGANDLQPVLGTGAPQPTAIARRNQVVFAVIRMYAPVAELP